MSINDFVEMTIFLCLICFSIYAKMQGFLEECFFFFTLYAEENDLWGKSPIDSADTLQGKKICQNCSSRTFSEINALLRFTHKFKIMVDKNSGKMIFEKKCQLPLQIPCGSTILSKLLYLAPFPRCVLHRNSRWPAKMVGNQFLGNVTS